MQKSLAQQFKHVVEQLIITHDNFTSGGVIQSSKQDHLYALPRITVKFTSWYNVHNYIDILLQDIYEIEPRANSSLILDVFSKKFKVETSPTKSFYPWSK